MVPNGFTLTFIPFGDSILENKTDSTIVSLNETTDGIIIENEDGETPLPQEGPLNRPLNETDSNGSND